jgi:hypothetical protein
MEKAVITAIIVNKREDSLGRFLKRDTDGCLEENDKQMASKLRMSFVTVIKEKGEGYQS